MKRRVYALHPTTPTLTHPSIHPSPVTRWRHQTTDDCWVQSDREYRVVSDLDGELVHVMDTVSAYK